MTPEVVQAIGSLWKLAAIIVLGLGLVLFKPAIQSWIGRMGSLKVRRGDTEVTVERDTAVSETPKNPAGMVSETISNEAANPGSTIEESAVNEPNNWFEEMTAAFLNRKFDEAKAAYESLRDSTPNQLDRLRQEATYYAFRYLYASDASALDSLRSLASNNQEVRSTVYSWIGLCFERSDRPDDAIAAYEQAAKCSHTDEDRARHMASAGSCLAQIGRTSEAINRLAKALEANPSGAAQAILYKKIADIEKERGNKFEAALAYEMAAFNRPEDTSFRFAAAYSQNEADLLPLSCANYSTLLKFNPTDEWALNNQGVSFSGLGLPIRAVEAHQQASQRQNTLAMANLAYKLLHAGFAKEAEELVNSALELSRPHENVASAMADIISSRENEQKRYQKIIQLAGQQQRFFHSFYPFYLHFNPIESLPSGEWFAGSVRAEITLDNNKFVVEWGEGPERRRVAGDLKNHAGIVKVHKSEKVLLSNEWRFGTGVTAYLYANEQVSRVVILSPGDEDNFYVEITRKDG